MNGAEALLSVLWLLSALDALWSRGESPTCIASTHAVHHLVLTPSPLAACLCQCVHCYVRVPPVPSGLARTTC